ncbi:hypothetical protein [Nocardioides convexus]|uniref:ABC transporter permease subunit n=1 Tax=Nocardioides convexus TaxID=2712224 RepID=UPI002418177A|nr:hypothetical protein [Nocardioides convexus]
MDAFTTPLLAGTATGALLLIAALGLALTFGQMGVINMAHGEFLMAGAYTTYLTQQVVTNTDLSLLVALPAAFLVAGALGLLLEVAIIQWMYRRPLDTLLVTVGVSLLLQQARQGRLRRPGRPGPHAGLARRQRRRLRLPLALPADVHRPAGGRGPRRARGDAEVHRLRPPDPRHRAEPRPGGDHGRLHPGGRPGHLLRGLRPGRGGRRGRVADLGDEPEPRDDVHHLGVPGGRRRRPRPTQGHRHRGLRGRRGRRLLHRLVQARAWRRC